MAEQNSILVRAAQAQFARRSTNRVALPAKIRDQKAVPRNDRRAGIIIRNDTNETVFIGFGSKAVGPDDHTHAIAAQDTWTLLHPYPQVPPDEIRYYCIASTGRVHFTEIEVTRELLL